jgi:uncharacterized membrane protein YedE/YeeE
MYEAVFVDPWPWWAGGLALGILIVLYSLTYNRLIGMSSTFENAIQELRQPLLPRAEAASSLEAEALALAKEHGLDPAELGLLTAPAPAAPTKTPLVFSPRFVIVGVLLGAILGGLLEGRSLVFSLGPVFDQVFAGSFLQAAVLLGGGFFVGFGARMAGGCPSGHALGGLPVFSPGSLLAIAGYFASGITVTFALRALS